MPVSDASRLSPPPIAGPDLGRRWAAVALGVLAVVVAVLAVQTFARIGRGVDFETYLAASRELWTGGDPYSVGAGAPFIYPLFLCVVLWPLWHLPLAWAAATWFAMSVGAAAIAVSLLAAVHGGLGRHRLIAALAIVIVLLFEVVQNNLRNGQVNLIVVACCAGFVWAWAKERSFLAALWLAMAIAIKITPALFLLMLALRRDWRGFVSTIVLTVTFVLVLPWAVAGPRVWSDSARYVETFVVDRGSGAGAPEAEHRPLSVPTFVRKHFGVVTPMDFMVLGGAVILVLALVIDGGNRGRRRDGPSAALLASAYMATMVFATPMTEVHHLAFLLPGLTLLTARALAGLERQRAIIGLVIVLIAFAVLRRVPDAAFAGTAGTWVLLGLRARNETRPAAQ